METPPVARFTTQMEWRLPKKPENDAYLAAEAGGGKGKDAAADNRAQKQKAKGGNGEAEATLRASSESIVVFSKNRIMCVACSKMTLDTAQCIRDLVAVANCHEGSYDHPLLQATDTAGKDYSAAVSGKGVRHPYGPPHVHKFLAAIKYISENLTWPDHMKQEKGAIEEIYIFISEIASIGTMAGMIKMFKTTMERNKKRKIIWATTLCFSVTVVDEEGVATDGRTRTLELDMLLCNAFQMMKFDKSTSGPPPSMAEMKQRKVRQAKK